MWLSLDPGSRTEKPNASILAIQRKTVKQNGLVPAKKKIGAKIGRSNGRDGSTGTASSLKTGSAFGTLKKSGESRSQETRRDGGVSVEEASGDRVRHNGIRTKKVKTGDWLPDGEVPDLIVISDKSDQEDDPRPESCAVASAKLKLVFDVGYKAPEWSAASESDRFCREQQEVSTG